MRVLVLSPFRDGNTGWAKAGAELTLALDAAGVDVVARALRFNVGHFPVPERLLELEAKPNRGPYDAVLQITLPQTYDVDRRAGRNVGYYFVETSDFLRSDWTRRIAAMDEAWVPCEQNADATEASSLPRPKVVPVPCDISRYSRELPVHPVRQQFPHDFLFYFVGSAISRKALSCAVAAFHLAFDPDEPVQLVLKVDVPGLGPAEAEQQVRAQLEQIRADLNLYPRTSDYRPEVLITAPHTDDQLDSLHQSADVFVSASCGEGWGIPAFDAMAWGKTPILSAAGAHLDFLGSGGMLVGGVDRPVTGMAAVHRDLYDARSRWTSVNPQHFADTMRYAYENRDWREFAAGIGRKRAERYGREQVGGLMRRLLGEAS